MTPELKAKELFDKYFIELNEHNECYEEAAIQCALIAVNEILNLNVFEYTSDWSNTIEYWEEVKQEIINL
jgi:hypothetical protein